MVRKPADDRSVDAVGQIGLDKFKEREKNSFEKQREFFEKQLETAVKNKLPVILHIRKAMSELLEYTEVLKKIRAVIFHSYSGGLNEAEYILKKGVNAYFSFCTTLINGHKKPRS